MPDPALANWDGREEFEGIKRLLFESLVIRSLALEGGNTSFRVAPRIEAGVPVKIEQPRAGDRNRYWDHPVSLVKPGEAVLEFIDYFDWNELGYIDFRYVRVRIVKFPSHGELVGREALISEEYVEILPAASSQMQL